MLLRLLLLALIIYFLYRLFFKPKKKNQARKRYQPRNGRRKNLDEIEEAEFEDITEKEKKK